MQRISFAPELSATLRRVSCWITVLLGLLHDLEQAPALLLGDGVRLGDADEVAHAAFVLLVVDLETRALPHGLAVQAMRFGRADLDDDRLVHLVGDHSAQPDLALAALFGVFGFCWVLRGGVGHLVSSVFLRPRLGLASSLVSAGSGAAAGRISCVAGADARTPKSRRRSTVMMRAMSWPALLIWLEFSGCPTACLKRGA